MSAVMAVGDGTATVEALLDAAAGKICGDDLVCMFSCCYLPLHEHRCRLCHCAMMAVVFHMSWNIISSISIIFAQVPSLRLV